MEKYSSDVAAVFFFGRWKNTAATSVLLRAVSYVCVRRNVCAEEQECAACWKALLAQGWP